MYLIIYCFYFFVVFCFLKFGSNYRQAFPDAIPMPPCLFSAIWRLQWGSPSPCSSPAWGRPTQHEAAPDTDGHPWVATWLGIRVFRSHRGVRVQTR